MILKFLKPVDRNLYRQWVEFNLEYLNEIKSYLSNLDLSMELKNLLAKDEMDPFKVEVGKMSSRAHESLLSHIDERLFYGKTELAVVLDVLTYLEFSPKPSLDLILQKMSPLSELHAKNTDIFTEDSVLVLSKLIYNRCRIIKVCRGIHLEEKDLLSTDLNKTTNTLGAAEGLCRLSGVHHALQGLRLEVKSGTGKNPSMIKDISGAMLSYRKCLISPEKMGYGSMDLSASEYDLRQKEVTPAVLDNLKVSLEKHQSNSITPTDFLLCLMETMKLSGIDLMI